MAYNNRCGCSARRNSNNGYGCLSSVGGRGRWENYPYYPGPCPDADGCYDRDEVRPNCRRFGMFSTMLPLAVAANGTVPLVSNNCMGPVGDFPVNSGLITIEDAGTYLATYTVRVPEGQTVDSTFTLNVNDASQSSAITEVGGEGPVGYTAQAVFDVGERATVALRSADAINITETSPQPLVTLTLVRLD